jgi:hypothetical protein
MGTIARWTAVAGAVLLGACATQMKMQIQANQRPGTNFSHYETYAWKSAAVAAPSWPAKSDRAALDWQLRSLVDQQMARRGYQLVGNDGADLLVDYRVETRDVDMTDSFSDYAQYRAAGGTESPGTAWVQGYEQGTLFIEVSDAKTRQLVWYGSASAVVNPKLRQERMPRAIDQIFARFPGRAAPQG